MKLFENCKIDRHSYYKYAYPIMIFLAKQILTTMVFDIRTDVVAAGEQQRDETGRQARSMLGKIMFPKTETKTTANRRETSLHSSYGVAGNVGVGFHFGGGYRIKNGDGKDEQQIVHSKVYDKYLGTSFGFGSLSHAKNGHSANVQQTASADQQVIYHDDTVVQMDDQGVDAEPTTEKPKPGVFRKISEYWMGGRQHLSEQPKSDYATGGVFKWSVKKFKNKNDVGTPR